MGPPSLRCTQTSFLLGQPPQSPSLTEQGIHPCQRCQVWTTKQPLEKATMAVNCSHLELFTKWFVPLSTNLCKRFYFHATMEQCLMNVSSSQFLGTNPRSPYADTSPKPPRQLLGGFITMLWALGARECRAACRQTGTGACSVHQSPKPYHVFMSQTI